MRATFTNGSGRETIVSMASSNPLAPVRLLVVDDQPPFHDAAEALIAATPGFEWVGAASSGEEALEQVGRLQPDLVLMDVRMPGIGGIEAARQIASCGAGAIVVLVTAGAPTIDVPNGVAAEVVSKREMSGSLLRRLWERHGQRVAGASR